MTSTVVVVVILSVLLFSIIIYDCLTSNVKRTPVLISTNYLCVVFVIVFDIIFKFNLVHCLYVEAI